MLTCLQTTKFIFLAILFSFFAQAAPKSTRVIELHSKKSKVVGSGLELVLKEIKAPSADIRRFVCSLKNKTKQSEILALTTTHMPLVSFSIFSTKKRGPKDEIPNEINPPFTSAGEVSPTLWVTFNLKPKKAEEVAILDLDLKTMVAGSSLNSWKLSSYRGRTLYMRANYGVNAVTVEAFRKANGKSIPQVDLQSRELKIKIK